MGQQLEPGTQFPMRPAQTIVQYNGTLPGHTLNIVVGAGTWGVGTRLPFEERAGQTILNDGNEHIKSFSAGTITLGPGQWHFKIRTAVTNTSLVVENMVMALTDGADILIPGTAGKNREVAADGSMTYCLDVVVHLTGITNVVRLNGVQSTDTGGAEDLLLIDDDFVATITKVGNVNET